MNFDSGKIASTFFTFWGFDARFGPIISTTSLASVHTEFSRSSPIASVIGSEVSCPQMEPVEQLDVDGVVKTLVLPNVAVVDPGASDEASVEQPVIPLHLL